MQKCDFHVKSAILNANENHSHLADWLYERVSAIVSAHTQNAKRLVLASFVPFACGYPVDNF